MPPNLFVRFDPLKLLALRGLMSRSFLAALHSKRNNSPSASEYDRESAPWLSFGELIRSRRSGGPLPPHNRLQQPIRLAAVYMVTPGKLRR